MDDRTQGALLLAVGGVALRLGLTDAALAYVKAGLQPWLAVAGVVLVVLGAATLLRAFTGVTAAAGDEHAHAVAVDDGHGHGEGGPRVAWLLLVPLLALLLVAPPPLGAFAAARQSSRPPATTQTEYGSLPEPTNGAVELPLSDYVFRALYDRQESLTGARVRLTGFVTPVEDGDGYTLTRFVLNCCAADGTAVRVAVAGDDVERAPDTWLAVEGTWEPSPDREPGELVLEPPVIVADAVTEIEQPEQPYEY